MSSERAGSSASVFIATSLDGFIAREDGGIDWLDGPTNEGKDEGEDFGFHAFFSGVDALVMGRNSFELVAGFPDWMYGDKPVFVLTTRPLEIPERLTGKVEVLSGEPKEVVSVLKERGYHHLYVDGGVTIQRFLGASLIDRMIISTLPVIIGTGIPLFGPTSKDVWLRHVSTRSFTQGLVQTEYEVIRG